MTSVGTRLRSFEAADLAPVEDLWVSAWKTTGLDVDFDARRPWLRAHLTRLAEHGVDIVIGLDLERRAAGFVTIDEQSGYLDQLCVAPSARGGGLAGELLDEAKRRAPQRIDLHVNVDNSRARRFYERKGFRVIGEGVSELSGLPVRHLRWSAAL